MDKAGVLKLRSENKLHPFVEERINHLFEKVAPGQYTIKEQYGITKGRTDTTTYLQGSGGIIHIELFGSVGTVERDVLNLLQSDADKAIAVVIDTEYDPKVAEAYYRNNPKKKFSTIWLSEIIDEAKEEHITGRLEEIIQELDRKKENKEEGLFTFLQDFSTKITYHPATTFFQHLAIFPRKEFDFFQRSADAEQLFFQYEPFGIMNAGDPIGFAAGWNYQFSHSGQFLIARQPAHESYIFNQIALGKNGTIIFTYGDGRAERDQDLIMYETGTPKIFNPTFNFAKSLFASKQYTGMIDVISLVKGVTGWKWYTLQMSQSREPRMLRDDYIFYEDEVKIPLKTFSVDEFADPAKIEEFYDDMAIELKRNTQKIHWSSKMKRTE